MELSKMLLVVLKNKKQWLLAGSFLSSSCDLIVAAGAVETQLLGS